jgi:hypothetical protein
MDYAWRSNSDGTAAAVACDEFAQVVYDDDDVLVVNVAQGMLPDRLLEDALVDALALTGARLDTEHALVAVATAFGLDAQPQQGLTGRRAITITPAASGASPGDGS